MNRLDGRIALVTGGASGIGLATAREFHAAGARVAVADVTDADAVAREVGGIFVRTDVSDPDAVEAMVAAVVAHFGRVDIVFNNAGIERHGPLAAMSPQEHRRVIDTNLNGVFYCLQSSVRAMMANPGPERGSIINTASVAGLLGVPGLSSYNAAKGGVVLLTKNAALEYAQFGIRVNAVCPGIIDTPMARETFGEGVSGSETLEDFSRRAHPLGRIGTASDVARLATFLASGDASFITGVAIPIDGGMSAGLPAPPMEN